MSATPPHAPHNQYIRPMQVEVQHGIASQVLSSMCSLQALTAVNEHKEQLSSIEELSGHLLSLEPVFDGEPVRKVRFRTESKLYRLGD